MNDRIEEMIGEPKPDDYSSARITDAWVSMLETRYGRRVVYDLLGICHYGMSAFAERNSTTNFVAGKQKVGEYIANMINLVAPDAFHLMLKEAKEDRDYDRERADKRSDSGD